MERREDVEDEEGGGWGREEDEGEWKGRVDEGMWGLEEEWTRDGG